jgi:hypothetical protein
VTPPGDMAEAFARAWAEGRRPPALPDPLADDLARELAAEPLGLPCSVLARRVRRQDGVVRQVLRDDPRFVASGETRGRRWRLRGGPSAGISRNRGVDAATRSSN